MDSRFACLAVAAIVMGQLVLAAASAQPAAAPLRRVDLKPLALDRVPVGTVIGKEAPKGFSHIVLFAIPTLTKEDDAYAPNASYYAQLFKFTILANVGQRGAGKDATYYLDKVARGFATAIDGRETVISSAKTLGATMGLFGRTILDENEAILDNDVRQVVRTDTMMIFDAKCVMLYKGEHESMIMRHAVLVDPRTGQLYTFIWLLTNNYEAAEPAMQALPNGMVERRLLSVKRDKFTLGLPSKDAFALRQVPQGKAVPYTPELRQAACRGKFLEADVPAIEETLRAAAIAARVETK
jgi:hypothetical protein